MARPRKPGRKYGAAHVELRKKMLRGYRPGSLTCWRCGQPITETDTSRIILGHSDDGTHYMGPEHRRCNNAGRMRYLAGQRRRQQQAREDGVVEMRPGELARTAFPAAAAARYRVPDGARLPAGVTELRPRRCDAGANCSWGGDGAPHPYPQQGRCW